MAEPAESAQVVQSADSENLAVGPTQVRIILGGSDTAGRLVLVEELLPGGPASPPVHVHRRMDHTFHVTEGMVQFSAGGKDVDVSRGGTVFVPHGVPHTFRNASPTERASFLEFDAPGQFDSYFRELARLLRDHGFDVERIRDLQARYDTWPP